MKINEFAKQSLRWLDGNKVATNAPDYMRAISNVRGDTDDPSLPVIALRNLAATGDDIQLPDRETILSWILNNPPADKLVLQERRSPIMPTTPLEFYQRVYKREVFNIRDQVRKILYAEIERFT